MLIRAYQQFLNRQGNFANIVKSKCKECGATFETHPGEAQYMFDRKLLPPKICPKCRAEENRKKGEANNGSEKNGSTKNEIAGSAGQQADDNK
jgi:hypothetical protein